MRFNASSAVLWNATASLFPLFLTLPEVPMARQQINSLRKSMRPTCSGPNRAPTILRSILDCLSGAVQWDRENLHESNRHANLWVFPVIGAARGPFFDGSSC